MEKVEVMTIYGYYFPTESFYTRKVKVANNIER